MPFAVMPDGTRIYYQEMGQGEPLLLVSGQGSDHTMWADLPGDFADRYRVIVYDHRGTGQSDKPAEPPYTTRGFARDAIALLDHLGIARAHAYGVSMGGRICQWLGIDHGDRVGALVLACTTPGNAHGVRRAADVDAAMANPSSSDPRAIEMGILRIYTLGWLEQHPEVIALARQRLADPLPEYAQRLHYAASEGHDSWDLLPSIAAPTLVIHGSDDQVNPTANAFLLAERIPGAELHIVEGGRHGFFLEFRDEVNRVVRDFLARHPLALG